MIANVDMNGLPDMHDGFFDGVWTSADKIVYLFFRTYEGQRATVILRDVEQMNISDFHAGNIVFDIVVVETDALKIDHIEQIYQLSDSTKKQELLKNAQQRRLSILTVSPSYGAECTVMFRSLEILPGHVLP